MESQCQEQKESRSQVRNFYILYLRKLSRHLSNLQIFNFLRKSIFVETCLKFKRSAFYLSGEIERELLTNTDALLLCLLHVRQICQCACPSNSYQNLGTTDVCLISLDPKETIWLADFMSNQKRQCSDALDKLLSLRDNIVNIAKQACLVCTSTSDINY